MEILRILFPALMVVGALGSLVVNVIDKGNYANNLQWFGAALLYTALMLRNIKKRGMECRCLSKNLVIR